MSEGINPDVFGEEDVDVRQASAAKGLFSTTKTDEITLDVSDLFIHEQTEGILAENFDRSLFTSTIEFKNEEVKEMQKDNVLIEITIVICAIIVIGYIYYLLQRRSIKKEIHTSYSKLNTL